ncbi:GNAT family N-acetyltransferase [Liquorilactobacillus mali]|uniref:Acetyltransferase n=1 Tax=Liquorilactobacillus mali KCTC 3596 = DSM 20444 TaxID=1046596 RepID=J0L875_9LACO|nr:GNAT family N-acetyltransferase [Liquorilactobacillus mali]EJF02066.1 acetyltransferase [Liquorilactobacillus mali KCTC 3596 = DSM 20444]KRN09953.1 acetyltransferase [Liquorilactobacillus mali KCTC 3596 = DSM 20444]MDV7758124.1 GNAT family N-acetyltransferase [Liquorilactobacillus mali]QFQ74086.1 N-acetyltransferase [Liquorilactobacillus mali]
MTIPDIKLRLVRLEDAPALLHIYQYYVQQTAITFEYDTPSVKEFEKRISTISLKYPYLIAYTDNKILGFAYLSAFHPRAAYIWAAEISIYLSHDIQHHGIGTLLYKELEKIAAAQNILNINACISLPKTIDPHLPMTSIYFHEKNGFKKVAHFHNVGYKFNTWFDMIWMEKTNNSHPTPMSPFIPYCDIKNTFYA